MRQLILRPGAIGDCILAFPALEHLTRASGYTEIWISSPVVPLISFAQRVRSLATTGIDLVGVGDLPMPEKLREEIRSFDLIVSWYGTNRPEFRDAIEEVGPACKFLDALPPKDFAGHAVDFFSEQVGAPQLQIPRVRVSGTARSTIVVHPFSGSKQKNWPLDHYRLLAQKLPLPIEWTAGPAEALAEAHRFEDLGKLALWLSGAALYIGNDSGITHLAAATGVPTLALFGPTDPAVWGARGEHVSILRNASVNDAQNAANRLLR